MERVVAGKKHIRTFRSKKLHPEHVKTLNEAIRKNAKGGDYNVHIQYTKPDGTKSERKIKPLGVKDKSLLLAHCHERNAIRSFRVERVSMIKKAFLNSRQYEDNLEKHKMGKSAFWNGFEKQALYSSKADELTAGAALGGGVPLGTTGHAFLAKRPEGHSRSGEWAKRVGGGTLGALGGAGYGALFGRRAAPIAMPLGAMAGSLLGETLGHHSAIKDYYDEDGKIKSKYRDSTR